MSVSTKKTIKEGIYGMENQYEFFRNVLDNIKIKQNDITPKYVLPLDSKYSVKAFNDSYIKYKPDVIFFIRKNNVLGGKVQLWESLRKYYGRDIASTIMPETFIFPKNTVPFNRKYKKGNYYILKNKKQRQEGIKLTNNYKEIMNHKKNGYSLVQTTLTNPLLYKGYKFNVRIYLVVICDNKNNVNSYIYNDGIINYCSQPYDKSNLTFENTITSFHNSKNLYELGYPNTISEFSKDLPIKNLFPKIKHKLKMTMRAVNQTLKYDDINVKSVQLFGADFLIDEAMNAHLLEINLGPGMKKYNEYDEKVRTGMLLGMMDLIDSKKSPNYIPI